MYDLDAIKLNFQIGLKKMLREAESFAPGHIANKWQSWIYLSILAPVPLFLHYNGCIDSPTGGRAQTSSPAFLPSHSPTLSPPTHTPCSSSSKESLIFLALYSSM